MIAIDTNLLVYAHRAATPQHQAARRALEQAVDDARGWGFTLASLTEFWSVVTHPSAAGRPSTATEASSYLDALVQEGSAQIWQPGVAFAGRLQALATELDVQGNRIFDLQIALTAFDHGAIELWSHDRNFITFPGIRLHDPLA